MITQAIANTFKAELLGGIHDFDTDVFKLALFRATANIVGAFGAATTNYSEMGTDEVVGAGYTAGGETLTGGAIAVSGNTAYIDFDDAALPGSTFTTRGALIYNSSKGDKAVAVWDFGANKIVTDGFLTIQFPAPGAGTAILRLS